MNPAFRRGILYGIASLGYTPSEFGDLLKRSSIYDILDVNKAMGTIGSTVSGLGDAALATAVGVPIVAGMGLGAAHYGMTRPDYAGSIADKQKNDRLKELMLRTRELRMRNGLPPGTLAG